MPDQPLSPTPESSPPNGGVAPSTPAITAPTPWRVPNDHPDAWARGKTGEELLALSSQMAQVIQQPQAPPPPRPPNNGLPTDDTWISRPNDAAAMVADARVAAAMAPALQGLQNMATANAATTRMLAQERYKETFAKWGPEVDAILAPLPPEQRTLDNYEKVVKYVRANHEDEIVTERARQMVASGGFGERSGGANGAITPIGGLDLTGLPEGMEDLMKRHNVTVNTVDQFCKANGWSREKWAAEAKNGKVFTSTSPFSWEMNDDQLGIKRNYGD